MITPKITVDLQLDSLFGATLPNRVQKLVDDELNRGRWLDGFDIAVSPAALNQEDGEKLLEVILDAYPEERINHAKLLELIDQELPQHQIAGIGWITADDGSFLLTDSLRVCRVRGDLPDLEVSPNFARYGIEFDSVDREAVRGRSFWINSNACDCPFVLSFGTGELIEGQSFPD
ncbi:MAG: hypothetical protein HKN23_21885 [Verrucomicrobiales bacterium]|nr:hypothetical protein [Verrucomicrobiales bacterium]